MWFQLRSSGTWHFLPIAGNRPLCHKFRYNPKKTMTVPYPGNIRCKDCDKKRLKIRPGNGKIPIAS
jgi:hypothetical protein